jgi:membrane protease YdiL (CAAX protease family)
VILLLGPGVLTAWSLILTRVYGRTRGSLLLSILMHASISSIALIFGQKYASDGEQLIWTAISVGTSLLITILLWLFILQTNSQSPGDPAGDAASSARVPL